MSFCHIKVNFSRSRLACGGALRVAATVAAVLAIDAGSLSSAEEYRWGGSVQAPRATTPVSSPAEQPRAAAPAIGSILKETDIAGLRAALNLTVDQRASWLPVETALSALARRQTRAEAASYVQRFRDRASALAATAAQLRRLKSVATPLIKTLDEAQKRAAVSFARRMGYGQLIAMF